MTIIAATICYLLFGWGFFSDEAEKEHPIVVAILILIWPLVVIASGGYALRRAID